MRARRSGFSGELLTRDPSGSRPTRHHFAAAALAAFVAFVYLRDLGLNPVGFFCDEARIGLQAEQLLPDLAAQRVGLFYDHFGYTLGILAPAATAPFVLAFGLSEAAVRLSAAVLMLCSLVVLHVLLRRLGVASAWLVVLLFALSPAVVHISRINFGHAPSILLSVLGFLFFVLAKQRDAASHAVWSGLCFGLSAYGYGGFMAAAPIYLLALVLAEAATNRAAVPQYRTVAIAIAVFAVAVLPIARRALTDPEFMRRFEDKDRGGSPLLSGERAANMLANYPKYFDLDYLFKTGESGLPGAVITRHSVPGAGVLSPIALPLLLLGIGAFLLRPDPAKGAFAPFFIAAVLYPLPDLITTRADTPPYTFAVFSTVVAFPLVAAYGVKSVEDLARGGTPAAQQLARRSIVLLGAATLVAGAYFAFVTYSSYPLGSSGFWGWQAGPREMARYFVDHRERYDEFYMDPLFNEPDTLLDFYITDPRLRAKAAVGDLDRLDPGRRQLFGVRVDAYVAYPQEGLVLRHVVKYPDGTDAFYLVEAARLR